MFTINIGHKENFENLRKFYLKKNRTWGWFLG